MHAAAQPVQRTTYYIDTINIDPKDAQEWRDVAREILAREREVLLLSGAPPHLAIPAPIRLEHDAFTTPRDEAAAALIADEELVRFCDRLGMDPLHRLPGHLVSQHRISIRQRQRH
jgi:hypothetical protein